MSLGEEPVTLRCVLEESSLRLSLTGLGAETVEVNDRTMGSGDLVDDLAGFLADVFEGLHGVNLRTSSGAWTRLWRAAQAALFGLAEAPTVSIREAGLGAAGATPSDLELDLTLEKAGAILAPSIDRILATVESFLDTSDAAPDQALLVAEPGVISYLSAAIFARLGIEPRVEVTPAAAEETREERVPITETIPDDDTPQLVRTARALLHRFHEDDAAAVETACAAYANDPDNEEAKRALDDLLFFIHGPAGETSS